MLAELSKLASSFGLDIYSTEAFVSSRCMVNMQRSMGQYFSWGVQGILLSNLT